MTERIINFERSGAEILQNKAFALWQRLNQRSDGYRAHAERALPHDREMIQEHIATINSLINSIPLTPEISLASNRELSTWIKQVEAYFESREPEGIGPSTKKSA